MNNLQSVPDISLVERNKNGEMFTTSLIVAEGSGNEHRTVLALIRNHITDFEHFGRVEFEIQPFETAGGTQKRSIAILNKEQATLLMTYMRNNDVVRDFKKRLVKAFSDMEKQLTQQHAHVLPANYVEALRALLLAEEERLELEASNREMAPKAGAWDTFLGVDGDMGVADAAKALCSRGGVNIGRNRLFKVMQELGWATHWHNYWEPTQYAVERGYLTTRQNMQQYKPSGESFIPNPTIRVTPKGLDRLAKHFNVIPSPVAVEVA